METIVNTPDLSSTLIAVSALAALEETKAPSVFDEFGKTPYSVELAKTPLDDDEDEDEDDADEDDDLEEDEEDDLEDDDLDDEDEDDDLEDEDDEDEDDDEEIEDDDDPKPLRVKTRS